MVTSFYNKDSIYEIFLCVALNITIYPPKGKHFFGAVLVGEKGEFVIPKEARELFNIKPTDKLLVLGDEDRGLALVPQQDLINFIGIIGIVNEGEKR